MYTLITADQIAARISELGGTISEAYRHRPLTVLGVLNGSVIFVADLMRSISIPHRVGFVQASSYRGATTEAGALTIETSLMPDIAGRDVLLVDDIFDTGRTLSRLIEELARFKPASLRTALLLWKEGRSQVDLTPDYHGFVIPNEFVVGYGLDYNDDYRHLPMIGVLEPRELMSDDE
jgi:hypoxanthine phosphoribosyltransferase